MLEAILSWAEHMKGGEAITVLPLPCPSLVRNRFLFTAGLTERVFQSLDGLTRV